MVAAGKYSVTCKYRLPVQTKANNQMCMLMLIVHYQCIELN